MYENEKTFDVTKMVYTGNNRIEFGDRSAILTGLRIWKVEYSLLSWMSFFLILSRIVALSCFLWGSFEYIL